MDALRDVFSFTSDQHPEASLRVVSFRGDEEMNGLYTFHLDLLGALDGDMLARLDDSLLGRAATLAFAEASAPGRVVHGHVTAYRIGDTTERGSIVHAELRPRLALLELRTKSRIFQDKSVKDVVDAIFAEWRVDHEWHLALPHALRTYCTQYQETDLSFVARLLASEGIAFYFVHPTDAGKEERVVLVDEPQYPPIEVGGGAKGAPPALVHRSGRFDPGAGDVFEVTTDRRMRHGAARLGDYDFRKPKLVVRALKLAKDEPAAIVKTLGADHFDVYLHGDRPEIETGGGGSEADDVLAQTTLEQLRRDALVARGRTRCRHLLPGHCFQIEGHPIDALNRAYAVTRVTHTGRTPELGAASDSPVYEARFEVVPAEVTYRPAVTTRSRQVAETAIVVGPGGQEIHADAHGRVKVQFHWDLVGRYDDTSSCWLRVAQAWAGAGMGVQFVPRIGMEVVVAFLGGDPDRPVIVGCVHNGTHPTPFGLPGESTKSGIKTQTSPGGMGFNELSFDDAAGNERVFLHAQRDLDVVAKGRHVETVGGDATSDVGGNLVETVGGDAKAVVVGAMEQVVTKDLTVTVEGSSLQAVSGDSDVRVTGDLTTRVEGAERRELAKTSESTVQQDTLLRVKGHVVTVVGENDAKKSSVLHVEGSTDMYSSGPTEIVADKSLTLRCGDSAIRITPDQIELITKKLLVTAEETYVVSEKKLKIHAKEEALLKSKKINLEGEQASAEIYKNARLDGQLVKLNCGPEPPDDQFPEKEKIEPTKIELKDQDGKPMARQRFVVVMPDGSERAGVLDADGKAELELEESGEISFPDVDNPKPG